MKRKYYNYIPIFKKAEMPEHKKLIDGNAIVGFDQDRIEELLGL